MSTKTNSINFALYGLNDSGLIPAEHPKHALNNQAILLHESAAIAFKRMQQDAKSSDITINIASGYRSFDYQLAIWERKYHQNNFKNLSPTERIQKIIRWSALPGTSRHHWGTDADFYDGSILKRTELTLEPWEYEAQGPCAELFNWLETHAHQYGFYRPYDKERGGVSPEPWHWSFAPLANQYLADFNLEHLKEVLLKAQISGYEAFAPKLADYVKNYVYNVASPNLS